MSLPNIHVTSARSVLLVIAATLALGCSHLLDGPTEQEAATDVAAEVADLERQHTAQATSRAQRQAQAEYIAIALEKAR